MCRITGGVHRRERGDAAFGNHLTLLVELGPSGLDQTWLCDLGLGDALRAPIKLTEGLHVDGDVVFRLERLSDGCWRFHNHGYGTPESFDFFDTDADEALFAAQNRFLQTDPQSRFLIAWPRSSAIAASVITPRRHQISWALAILRSSA